MRPTQKSGAKPTLRLSRGQSQTCLNFAEAEQGRVAEGKPMANGQRLIVLRLNLKVSLWVSAYWAKLWRLLANNNVAAV